LQLDLNIQVIQCCLCSSNAGFCLSYSGRVVLFINFDQKVSCPDALKVVDGDYMHLTGNSVESRVM
jgi:hypothetical protein